MRAGTGAESDFEALSAELDSFAYSVSHDLRAPVRAVIGYARALQEDYSSSLDLEGRRLLSIVASEALRINELLDGLLGLSRLMRAPLESSLVDMASLARDVVAEQVRLNSGTSPAVEIGELPHASGDLALLRQVWVHLVANAVKFTSKSAAPRLEIYATLEPGRVTYSVRDNGAGFDMTYADKLFGIFQRLHRADAYPGVGIGLATVKRIVHRHGGTVVADARLDKGATFSFTLPAAVTA